MLEQIITNDYNSFWLIISTVLIVAIVTIGLVLRGKNSDKKDTFIFAKSSDNTKDIVLNNNKTHTQLVDGIPLQYHRELHSLEVSVEDNRNKMQEIIQIVTDMNKKLDLAIERIIELEKQK